MGLPTLPPSISLARVKKTGKRYIVLTIRDGKVRCLGEVRRVSGASANHGDNVTFLVDAVEIFQVDRTRELLEELWKESPAWEVERRRREDEAERKKLAREKKKYLDEYSPGRYHLTEAANKHFEAMGYDVGMDGIGNYIQPNDLESAAIDAVAYDDFLTRFGIPEGYGHPARESAADMFYEGLRRAQREKADGAGRDGRGGQRDAQDHQE